MKLMKHHLREVPGYQHFAEIHQIKSGSSQSGKYHIITTSGQSLLLRIENGLGNKERYERHAEGLKFFAKTGILMAPLISWGVINGGQHVYLLQHFILGTDVSELLEFASTKRAYDIGYKVGQMVKKIKENTNMSNDKEELNKARDNIRVRIEKILQKYKAYEKKFEEDKWVIKFIQDKRTLIEEFEITICHRDLFIQNLLMVPTGEIAIIDFEYWQLDHIYMDLIPLDFIYTENISEKIVEFHRGKIAGYFEGEPPEKFYEIYAYITALRCMALWTTNKGLFIENIFNQFDYFKEIIPQFLKK